ncbi:UNVERIFIED_CONTAM: hypothetical protein GTU68_064676 [Idotea baltica]|nr:hypothetical protein [Idotea baltica]
MTLKKTLTRFLLFFAIIFAALSFSSVAYSKTDGDSKLIRLATTTSTENSGLLRYLLPEFEKDEGYKVHVISVGTGKALRMGRDGDVDIILVHALKAEEKFVAEGYGVKRYPVMYNDFVIIGPADKQASFKDSKNVVEVFNKIADDKMRFVSRGDDSGTHKKELSLWKASKAMPSSKNDSWYVEAGQGMGKVLQMADEMGGFTMTDRGTWLAYKDKLASKVIFEGDPAIFNPYGIIAINPKKHTHVNETGANALIKWITAEKGQTPIG